MLQEFHCADETTGLGVEPVDHVLGLVAGQGKQVSEHALEGSQVDFLVGDLYGVLVFFEVRGHLETLGLERLFDLGQCLQRLGL